MKTVSDLAAEAIDLFASQQAMTDDKSLMRMGGLIAEAYDLGCLVTRHERHDGEWDDTCKLCDAERHEGQVYTPGKGWSWKP